MIKKSNSRPGLCTEKDFFSSLEILPKQLLPTIDKCNPVENYLSGKKRSSGINTYFSSENVMDKRKNTSKSKFKVKTEIRINPIIRRSSGSLNLSTAEITVNRDLSEENSRM